MQLKWIDKGVGVDMKELRSCKDVLLTWKWGSKDFFASSSLDVSHCYTEQRNEDLSCICLKAQLWFNVLLSLPCCGKRCFYLLKPFCAACSHHLSHVKVPLWNWPRWKVYRYLLRSYLGYSRTSSVPRSGFLNGYLWPMVVQARKQVSHK